jgi:hypothetical protein
MMKRSMDSSYYRGQFSCWSSSSAFKPVVEAVASEGDTSGKQKPRNGTQAWITDCGQVLVVLCLFECFDGHGGGRPAVGGGRGDN